MHKFMPLLFIAYFYFVQFIQAYNDNLPNIEEYFLLPRTPTSCLRSCRTNGIPMICRYKFQVEWYQTMSRACFNCPQNQTDCLRPHCVPADGNNRPIIVINRQMPGPSIQVCKGDEIIVDVENALYGEQTTIHWHGHHQRKTPYMDGVPFITQCPILTENKFRYHFSADHSGTHFWHSHTGLQRGEGAFGSMIIRTPKDQDIHGSLYDFDVPSHVMIVLDWTHKTSIEKFTHHHHSDGNNKPDSLLVNGLGYFESNNGSNSIPAARFRVQQGFRYRFRVISAEFLNCPIEISIDNHTLTMIASDGNDFQPVEVESFVIYAGERFDFILNASETIENYWIRYRGLMDCDKRFTSAHQVAVLHYYGAEYDAYPPTNPDYDNSHKEGLQLNALNQGTTRNDSVNIVEVNSTIDNDESLKENPDLQFYISYDFYNLSNPHFYAKGLYKYFSGHPKFRLTTPQLNHISNKLQNFPLLSERNLINSNMFCNDSTVSNCVDDYCQCTHVLQVPLNATVELVLIDKGNMFDANHPFHLHGNSFRVIAMERLGSSVTVESIKALDRAGLIQRKLDKAPLKDTVTVPDGGYTIIRFKADNPGYWLFHCHIDFHAEIGMSLVFKIGEHSDFLPVPTNYPKCGDWLPDHDAIEPQEETKNATQGVHCTVFDKIVQSSVGTLINLESHCAGSSVSGFRVHNIIYVLHFILYILVRSI